MNFIRANIEKLPEKVKIFYIGEIVNLLQYIHSVGVTHRDLKVQSSLCSLRTSCLINGDTSNSSTSAQLR